METKNIIPVCAITDEKLTFTVPALFISIIESSNRNNFFKFYCFVNNKVTNIDKEKIKSIQNLYDNCSVDIIDMDEKYQDCINRHSTVTNACLYKFSIIEKLIEHDKVLYLDTDIFVNGDLTELYNIDLRDNYIGGVFNIFYYIYKKELIGMLKIPDLESYINAGVMLMNLKKMREDNLLKTLESYIGKFEGSVDQHIFNKVCYGKILNIPPKYNVTIKYQELYKRPEAEAFYTKAEIDEAINNPVIMHYAGIYKPWTFANMPLAWKWYSCFRKSEFRDYTLTRTPFMYQKSNLLVYLQGFWFNTRKFLNDNFHINSSYFQFLSVLKILRKKNISPVCFLIKSTKSSEENKYILDLISKLKEQGRVVFVISKSGGSLKKAFKSTSDYFFIMKRFDIKIYKSLRIFQFLVLAEAIMFKEAESLTVNSLSYLWLISNAKMKNKIINNNPIAKELLSNSKNVLENLSKEQIIAILSK